MLCRPDNTDMVPGNDFGNSIPGTTSSTMQHLAFCREKGLSVLMKSMKCAPVLSRGTSTLFSYLSRDTLNDISIFQCLQQTIAEFSFQVIEQEVLY